MICDRSERAPDRKLYMGPDCDATRARMIETVDVLNKLHMLNLASLNANVCPHKYNSFPQTVGYGSAELPPNYFANS